MSSCESSLANDKIHVAEFALSIYAKKTSNDHSFGG